jgi:hypothetical protein
VLLLSAELADVAGAEVSLRAALQRVLWAATSQVIRVFAARVMPPAATVSNRLVKARSAAAGEAAAPSIENVQSAVAHSRKRKLIAINVKAHDRFWPQDASHCSD